MEMMQVIINPIKVGVYRGWYTQANKEKLNAEIKDVDNATAILRDNAVRILIVDKWIFTAGNQTLATIMEFVDLVDFDACIVNLEGVAADVEYSRHGGTSCGIPIDSTERSIGELINSMQTRDTETAYRTMSKMERTSSSTFLTKFTDGNKRLFILQPQFTSLYHWTSDCKEAMAPVMNREMDKLQLFLRGAKNISLVNLSRDNILNTVLFNALHSMELCWSLADKRIRSIGIGPCRPIRIPRWCDFSQIHLPSNPVMVLQYIAAQLLLTKEE